MFGCNHDDVVPDIMTMGKGMASGFPGQRRDLDGRDRRGEAVLAPERVVVELRRQSAGRGGGAGDDLRPFATTGSSRTPRASDGCCSTGLRTLAARHPLIANVRGRGLLIGFDLVRRTGRRRGVASICCRRIDVWRSSRSAWRTA